MRSDFKGHGLGWGLLSLMVQEAQDRGLEKIESIEDRSNSDAVELEQNIGFRVEPYPDDPRLLLLSKSWSRKEVVAMISWIIIRIPRPDHPHHHTSADINRRFKWAR